MNEELLRIIDLFDEDEVTTADKIDRPAAASYREMFDDFNARNPMAGGGMLVQPGFGGTRQGYANPKGNPEFGKTITGAQFKDTIQPKNLEKLKKLEEIINKSNSQYKKSLTSKAALQLAGFKEGYQSMSAQQTKLREEVRKLIGTLQSTGDKMDNYINNVMLSEDALVKDFKNPMQHLQKKFGVSRGFTDAWAPTSQVVKDNKRLFNNLANALSFNKYKQYADGTPRLMSDFSVVVQNKLPSSTSLLRADSAEKFILQSAYRHFKYNKDVGKASKINFIGDPDLLPINEWKFIKGGKLFSLDPAEDTIKFQGKNYKNNYLNRVDAKDIYKNDFGDVYKIFDDLDKYMNTTTTVGNKDVKLDTVLRRKLFDATGKKDYLLRRAVEIDHLDINKDPFSNLRLLDRRTNVQAGLLKRLPKYKNNPKLLNKVLTDIGYTTPYKNVDTFIKRTTRNIDTPIKVIGDSKKLKVKNLIATLGGGNCGRGFKNQGGRIGLQNGTPNVDVCFKNATQRINSGFKNATPAEARNYTKLLNAVKGSAVIGKNLLKFGIVPEALYVGADSLIRMGYGDTFKEAGLRAADFFVPGDQMQEADKLKVQRTLGDAAATNVGRVFDYRNQIANIDSLEQQKQNFENLSGGGAFDYVGDLSQDIKNIDTRLNQAKNDLQNKFMVSEAETVAADRALEEAYDISKAKSPLARLKSFAQNIEAVQDDPFLSDVATPQKTQEELNLDMFPTMPRDFLTEKTSDLLDRTQALKQSGYDVSTKDLMAEQERLRSIPLSQDVITYGPEQMYGAQGTFFGQPLAGGGIAKLAGVDSGPPPEKGPMSQGLQGLMKRVRNR